MSEELKKAIEGMAKIRERDTTAAEIAMSAFKLGMSVAKAENKKEE